ncbi:MAG: toll/interleukin-1 receptor domain-containing protein [Calditrichaeota bacterium]|nr:toll/interleukin-1 receptor domain-containing protein [Calditrichota bacterium]MCB9391111.1 toll/interleukin-1 receptor domain-containing protein [Calditrichota bacterium]
MAFKIVVSYSTKDIKHVERIQSSLSNEAIEVFVADSSVLPGDVLDEKIKMAIRSCDLFVVLWSSESKRSEWVSQEIGIAEGCDKTILPIVLDDVTPPPAFIQKRKYINACTDFGSALSQLREAVLARIVSSPQMSIGAALVIGGAIGFLIASMLDD